MLDSAKEHRNAPEPTELSAEDKVGKGKPLRCAICNHVITYQGQRISEQGAHEHTRTNPHGITFRFGCFAWVPGCQTVGEASSEFGWFSGYSWRIVVCSSCKEHLGWSFRDTGGAGFYGLILARLID